MRKPRKPLEAPSTYLQAKLLKPYIYVDQDTIDRSVRRNRFLCIIANAVRASLPGVIRVVVDAHTVRFSWGLFRYRFDTPADAAIRAKNYDDGEKIKPWSFRLLNVFVNDVQPAARSGRLGIKRTKYERTGKHAGKFLCGSWKATRWHGLKIPNAAAKGKTDGV